MKYCSNCGTQMGDEAKFCPRCGLKAPGGQRPQEPIQQPREPYQQRPQQPPQQAYQQPSQEPVSSLPTDGYQMASAVAGEMVLSSWEDPQPSTPPQSPQPQATNSQRTTYVGARPQTTNPPTSTPQGAYHAAPRPQQRPQSIPVNPKTAVRGNTKAPKEPKKKKSCGCIIAIVVVVVIALICVAIFLQGCLHINLPPDPGTPEPAPHDGVFVNEADTLIFNGDGKTIAWHFANEIPGIGEKGQGQYVFRFGHGSCRYDVAETFKIMETGEQGESRSFVMPSPASETAITILRSDLPGTVIETFRRTSAAATSDSQ
ncbi:MAG: zinc ribbon domain-containing protein [Bacteroidales bacterium]|nr:zinc ribbon domain-containing protein [Bacteroidales bacterium]